MRCRTGAHPASGIAYLLWFFLGIIGVHHVYLGKVGRAVGYLFTGAWLTIGWWVDLFTLPAQVNAINARLRMEAAWGHGVWTYHVPPPVAAAAVPAGWYPDPAGSSGLRYWDGASWSHHVTGREGVVGEDPRA